MCLTRMTASTRGVTENSPPHATDRSTSKLGAPTISSLNSARSLAI
jgi:hypothetical protein